MKNKVLIYLDIWYSDIVRKSAPWNSLAFAFLPSEAPVWGQVCGQSRCGGGGPGEAAAQPDVGGHQSYPISAWGPAGGSHEGKTLECTNTLFCPQILMSASRLWTEMYIFNVYIYLSALYCTVHSQSALNLQSEQSLGHLMLLCVISSWSCQLMFSFTWTNFVTVFMSC